MQPVNHRRKIVLFLFLIVFILACSSILPTEEPPGVGEKAERGYTTCAPIITALEQYLLETGEYPGSLAELVPNYLAVVPNEVNDQPISYTKTEEGYSLSFHYIGPGMNSCTFTPADEWSCSGAY